MGGSETSATQGTATFPWDCGHPQVVFSGPRYSEELHHPQSSTSQTLRFQDAATHPNYL